MNQTEACIVGFDNCSFHGDEHRDLLARASPHAVRCGLIQRYLRFVFLAPTSIGL